MWFFVILFFYFIKAYAIETCNVLALSGGASRGAFEAGIVANLLNNSKRYDVITGVSAGAINGAYISSIPDEEYSNIDQLILNMKSLWSNLKSSDVYHYELFLNKESVFDTKPLRNTLHSIFDSRQLHKPFIFSSVSLIDGEQVIFTGDNIVDELMSSTAIPFAFPPYRYNNNLFVDGGLMGNVLIHEGFQLCDADNIVIDIIVCATDPVAIPFPTNIIQMIPQLIDIIADQVEYNQLMQPQLCNQNVDATVYSRVGSFGVSVVDFNQGKMLFESGFSMKNVKKEKVNVCKK